MKFQALAGIPYKMSECRKFKTLSRILYKMSKAHSHFDTSQSLSDTRYAKN